jgi:hypothetical protein
MNKKGFMVLTLAAAAVGAASAQTPTMDKLKFSGASGVVVSGSASHYSVGAANKQISGAVVIPARYDGDPVVAVEEFENCTRVTSVIIPNNVVYIRQNAFKGCTGLTSVTIPETVTDIDTGAFQNCTSLTSVTFQRPAMASNLFKSTNTFPGDLRAKYMAKNGGAGTYTRARGSNTWTKQASSGIVCPHCGQLIPNAEWK